MKLDIPYYIRQVLREQRMVHVPGIGTFSLNQKAASFNDDKTNISPPSLNIAFKDDESDDQSLLKYILDTGLLTEAKAKKKIEQFTQSTFNKLLNVDSFLIEGIGTIAKRPENDKVEFEPKLSELTREFSDLIPLNLTPISRFTEQAPVIASSDVPPVVKESNSSWTRILLFTLLLLALCFIGQYVYNNYFNQSDTDEIGIVDDSTVIDEDSKESSNEKELKQKYEEIDELIDPQSDNGEVVNTINSTTEEVPVADEKETKEANSKVTDEDKSVDQKVVEDVKVKEPVIKEIEPIDNIGSKSIAESNQNDKPTNKHADIIPESGECIIVVGSFIKSLNAIKMVSLLERKGYKVYQSEYKGYTRVGLKYECIDEDLEVYLQNIRKKVSKRAWYLDPLLDVPFPK